MNPCIMSAMGPSAGFISVSVGPGWMELTVMPRAEIAGKTAYMPWIADFVMA